MPRKERRLLLVNAEVFPPAEGVLLNVVDESGDKHSLFLEVGKNLGFINLTLRPGQNAEIELLKVCNLLNGLIEDSSGEWVQNKNYKPKTIVLIEES